MVTMRDVASHAGVSVATVSNYLNSPDIVTEATRAKVRTAIEAVGYLPNETARQLRTGRSRMLGFIALELDNTYVSAVLAALEQRAVEAGLYVSIICTHGDLEREAQYIRMLVKQRVYGLVLASGHTLGSDLELLRSSGVPAVLIDHATDSGFPSCNVNDRLGGRLAVEHLIAGGARRVCFVGDAPGTFQVSERLQGARDAISAVGGIGLDIVPSAERTVVAGLQIGMRLAAMEPDARPDAVFAANDSLAVGVLEALRRAPDIRVPDDISVIGYDDNPLAASEAIALSTIRRPREELGMLALDLLRESAEAPQSAAPRHIVIQPELVPRRTTRNLDPGP